MLKSTSKSCVLEKTNTIAGSIKRPGDIYVTSYNSNNQRDCAIDVSCVSSVSSTVSVGCSKKSLYATDAMEKKKNKIHLDDCLKNNFDFLPFVVDSFGAFGQSAKKIIKFLSESMGDTYQSARRAAKIIKKFNYTMSLSICKNTSRAILSRISTPDCQLALIA